LISSAPLRKHPDLMNEIQRENCHRAGVVAQLLKLFDMDKTDMQIFARNGTIRIESRFC
jgi:hypothetical protein